MAERSRCTTDAGHLAFGLVVALCCCAGFSRTADATCGDHLVISKLSSTQVDQQLPTPCQQPECRGVPVIPNPPDMVFVPTVFQQMLVTLSAVTLQAGNEEKRLLDAGGAHALIGMRHRLERPPQ